MFAHVTSSSPLGKKKSLVTPCVSDVMQLSTNSCDKSGSSKKKEQKCIKSMCPEKIQYEGSIAKHSESLIQCKCVKHKHNFCVTHIFLLSVCLSFSPS